MQIIKEIHRHCCSLQTTVKDVLQRINSSPYLFQMVLDDAGRLVGTITDGDIRRAMLHGVTLDDPSEACMQANPKTGLVNDPRGNQAKLLSVGSSRAFLPILDESGIVVEVLLRANKGAGIAQALVMAGGYGKRLGERTRETPKPLLNVGNKPILEHIITSLENAGVRKIYISVHYLSDKIRQYVYDRNNLGTIVLVEESEPLGTAGALGLLEGLEQSPLLVINGDVISDIDLTALVDFQLRHALDATICVSRYDIDVPFGVVRYDKDGKFSGIEEKPRISNYIAAGVYYLSPHIVHLVKPNQRIDMPDLLNLGKEIGQTIGLFPIHEYWADVGKPSDLESANKRLLLK